MKIARKVLLIALIILVLIPVFLILWVVFLMGGSDFRQYPQEKAAQTVVCAAWGLYQFTF